MRGARLLLAVMTALAVGGCMRQQQTLYVIDPNTGQPVPVVTQQQLVQPQYAQGGYGQPTYQQPAPAPDNRALYSSSPANAQQAYAQPTYQQPYQPPAPRAAPSGGGRGLFTPGGSFAAQPNYAQPSAPPVYAQPQGGAYAAAPNAYTSAPATSNAPYTLDSGDRLRVVVFGQDGITNSYTVDAGGNVTLPLVGSVPARGFSTQQLSQMISERLKQGTCASRTSRSRLRPIGRSSSSARSPIRASILTSPT